MQGCTYKIKIQTQKSANETRVLPSETNENQIICRSGGRSPIENECGIKFVLSARLYLDPYPVGVACREVLFEIEGAPIYHR